MPEPHDDFEAFWKHFLASHTRPAVRWSHVAALSSGALGVVGALSTRRPAALFAGAAAFGALAVFSHRVVEGEWPQNFGHPVWGGRAFLRLCVRTITGSVNAEVDALREAPVA